MSDSQVFFSTGSGEVLARDQRSGKLIWKTSVANEAVGGRQIRLSNNVLFVPISYETVGLDARDGKILWRYQAPADSFATPHAYPGYVVSSIPDADVSQAFLPAWGGSVSSLHLQSGQVQWTWRLAAHSRSGAAGVRAVGDTIYVATWQYENASGTLGRPKLTALDRATGHELWAISLPLHFPGIAVQGAPVVYGPLIFLSGSGGYLWAIDRTTRAIRWRFIPNSPRTATITQSAVFDHTIYHYGGDERLYAIDAVSGRTVWVSNIPAMITRDLLVTPKRVYAIHGSSLYVYDRLSGRFILEQVVPHTNDGIYSSSLAYANGRIFVTTSAGAQCFFEP